MSNELKAKAGFAGAPGSAMNLNRYEQARKERQYWMLSQSEQAQEERIAIHYTAVAHLTMLLRQLVETRKQNQSDELDATIKYLTSKIREDHLMEFGIELEWPNDQAHQPPCKKP